MLRFLFLILLIYIAYQFYKVFIRYKRKVDELERELKRRKIDELKDTDYEEIK
jgi:Na+-transporting methylmalonyl-CoA/oxaloacetate decarboxylase gamma subunit